MRSLLALLLWFLSLPACSQTQRAPSAMELRNSPAGRAQWKKQQDSLQRLFYQQPPYVEVSYYRNANQVPWSPTMTLLIMQQHQWVTLHPMADNKFLLPPLQGDSLRVGLKQVGHPLATTNLRSSGFVHGATLTFGFIDRRHLTERVRSSAEWMPTRQVLQNINLTEWRQAKGLRGLRYLVVEPRVYGDGTVHTITTPVFRRKQPKAPSKKR